MRGTEPLSGLCYVQEIYFCCVKPLRWGVVCTAANIRRARVELAKGLGGILPHLMIYYFARAAVTKYHKLG